MSHPLKVAIAADGRHNYEIAAAARINPSALSRISSGKERPSEAVMVRLAEALGRDVGDLFPDIPTTASVAAERATQGLPPAVQDPRALAAVSAALSRSGRLSGDAA